jgi:serine protease Do
MKANRKFWITGAALLALGAVLGAWVTARTGHFPFSYSQVTGSAASVADVGEITLQTGFGPIVNKVLPAVVSITSSKTVRQTSQGPEDLFRFFGDPNFPRQLDTPRQQRVEGQGSGVITSAEGYVLTNNHVVDGATEVKVALQDKREFTAKVVGRDSKSDLAVLKIDASGLPVVQFGDSESVKVGDVVLAMGNPFGVGQTVTMGIVSATSRHGLGIEDYEDFIQTDAAINPGNSGGALVNMKGDLVGINTAILSNGSGGNQGVGFAIPVKMARNVMDQIVQKGKVTRGFLGVNIQKVTPEIAKSFNLRGEPRGALISDVTPGSPAEKGGLRQGDIVLELDGAKIADRDSMMLKVANLKPGSSAQFKVFREGAEHDLNVTVGERPDNLDVAGGTGGGPSSAPKLGLQVEPITPQITRQFGLSAGAKGIVVTGVQSGSAAEEAGLETGDVIQQVNRQAVNDPAQFQRMVSGTNGPLLFLIARKDAHLFLTIRPQQ